MTQPHSAHGLINYLQMVQWKLHEGYVGNSDEELRMKNHFTKHARLAPLSLSPDRSSSSTRTPKLKYQHPHHPVSMPLRPHSPAEYYKLEKQQQLQHARSVKSTSFPQLYLDGKIGPRQTHPAQLILLQTERGTFAF